MLLAAFNLHFLPPLSPGVLVGLLALAAVVAIAVGWLLGPTNPVARRGSLWALRGTILALIVLIIFNPASVQQLPGPVQRPEIFYLVDTSASMQMGNPLSRWEQSKALIAGAREKATRAAAVVKPFRFGQRLGAIDQPDQVGLAVAAAPMVTPATNNEYSKPSDLARPRPVAPLDGDTRLQAALKQISSRFGRVPPVGIVVFSDGRVHDETGLDQIAAQFAKLKVPIHVVPIGDTGKGGDVAIAAVVAPPRVRKFTEVEVQVFVRSFGYDGKRGEVQLIDIGEGERAGRKLASLPITLQSGYQSVSLSFRTDLSTRKLRVQIPALADEVSDKNNQLST
ncbi:MAG: VWA domain-containing protein, partial [Pirellulaceae bacterium]|nr:VWA domain-containing protein [Pirellulaceae bacterium]